MAREGTGQGAPLPVKLRCAGVRKTYGPVVALDTTDLEMPEGEFLTLLGPSGSGKTTLLMLIAGLLAADAGEIWIDGRNASRLPSYARDIGMVFQSYALFPHMTVAENLAFPLRMRRWKRERIADAVARSLSVVRLEHAAGRYPRELSGGQQQRIALARALVYGPSIVLMDEPLGALDKKLRDQMQLEIKQIQSELGATVLYVTHDQEEAMTMSDRICLMNNGGIEQIGTPEELYYRPVSRFAADFLGESNLFAGRLAGSGAATALEVEGRRRALPSGAAGTDLPAGAVTVMVRPERVTVARAPSPGRHEGTVEMATMLAGLVRVAVRLDTGSSVVARVLDDPAGRRLQPGERVMVDWPDEAAILVTRDSVRGA